MDNEKIPEFPDSMLHQAEQLQQNHLNNTNHPRPLNSPYFIYPPQYMRPMRTSNEQYMENSFPFTPMNLSSMQNPSPVPFTTTELSYPFYSVPNSSNHQLLPIYPKSTPNLLSDTQPKSARPVPSMKSFNSFESPVTATPMITYDISDYISTLEESRKRKLDEIEESESLKKEEVYSKIFKELKRKRERVLLERQKEKIRQLKSHKDFSPEEIEKRKTELWSEISFKSVPKVFSQRQQSWSQKLYVLGKHAGSCAKIAQKHLPSSQQSNRRDLINKSKRLTKDVLLFWRKHEREERELRKKAEKEELERRRVEEKEREKRRQVRKLNFLITQTELYSHFVGNKMGSLDPNMTAGDSSKQMAPMTIDEVDFATIEDDQLNAMAQQQAQNALALQQEKTRNFDQQSKQHRQGKEKIFATAEDQIEMDFREPGIFGDKKKIPQPKMLTCQLKPYQLKGLNWLANLYEQGINGILADDMGLGKTVQSISLLAWLAETQNTWGPFLVVSPASTLHNWQQEFTKFTPQMKCLPYWGTVKDRKTLRKFWTSKKLSSKEAPFHVLITSYQIIVADQQYFQRMKWHYMILDEAHAIKSSGTARWKILLNFNCRNRLLLTGTPIQNNMQELWALLHFIMPTLFDSHQEFSDWFSKDIESHAAKQSQNLNQRQLARLHMILKPFMLRRIKSDVENELGEKIEKTIYCQLTARQQKMYEKLSSKISIDALLEKAALKEKNSGAVEDMDESLMNVVMQFRKVCNHPQIFEQADSSSPFYFANTDNENKWTDFICASSSHSWNDLVLPSSIARLYLENFFTMPSTFLSYKLQNAIWRLENVFDSDFLLSLISGIDLTAGEFFQLPQQHLIRCLALNAEQMESKIKLFEYFWMNNDEMKENNFPGLKRFNLLLPHLQQKFFETFNIFSSISFECFQNLYMLSGSIPPAYIPPVSAPYPKMYSSLSRMKILLDNYYHHQQTEYTVFGLPKLVEPLLKPLATRSLVPLLPKNHSFSHIQVPNAKQLLFESGKLKALDPLLFQLRSENHRVLIYFQMTKMIDLMEEYLAYRQFSYLRLDGSSKISDRRDLVSDWQTRPDLFIFLLSTRAGGLGINLTAADTVIFYDSDWNPTVDQQAMDRAHRLGQTRQVTVYRLITKNTIEERILERAMQKDEIQRVVISGGDFKQEDQQ